MSAGRSESITALVVAAAAVLATCVFGFLSFTPGVEPSLAGNLQLGFFAGGVVSMGAIAAYFIMSRRSASGEQPSKFDRLLDQRAAALRAVPIGLVAVAIGVLWYISRTLGESGALPPPPVATESFASIDTAGIGAFLGFGSVYVIVATYLAIRAERAALRVAREEGKVNLS